MRSCNRNCMACRILNPDLEENHNGWTLSFSTGGSGATGQLGSRPTPTPWESLSPRSIQACHRALRCCADSSGNLGSQSLSFYAKRMWPSKTRRHLYLNVLIICDFIIKPFPAENSSPQCFSISLSKSICTYSPPSADCEHLLGESRFYSHLCWPVACTL